MENIKQLLVENKFAVRVLAAALGVTALAFSCAPQEREPTPQQRHDPRFNECVNHELDWLAEHSMPDVPAGISAVGPSDQQIAEDKCLDKLFPK